MLRAYASEKETVDSGVVGPPRWGNGSSPWDMGPETRDPMGTASCPSSPALTDLLFYKFTYCHLIQPPDSGAHPAGHISKALRQRYERKRNGQYNSARENRSCISRTPHPHPPHARLSCLISSFTFDIITLILNIAALYRGVEYIKKGS